MENMLTVTETAAKWRITRTRIHQWIAQGRIDGAHKFGPVWLIPAKAKRPPKMGNGKRK